MPKIYESPDGGKTVYERDIEHVVVSTINPSARILIKGTAHNTHDDHYVNNIWLWHDIVQAGKDNPALRELLDQIVTMYKLIKEQA